MLKKGAATAGKHLLRTGADVLSDVVSGKNVKESAKTRFSSAGKSFLGDMRDQFMGPGGSNPQPGARASRKRKLQTNTPSPKKRRMPSSKKDVFARKL
jgi:hypothetical protein